VRYLGIDYGARRWGLAFGDELGVATPLPALVQSEAPARWAALAALVSERRITEIILGHPINMDDTAGFKAKEVEAFAARLRETFELPVHLVDERLTSCEAEEMTPKHKRQGLRRTGIIDSRAATIILQDYLNLHYPLP
jgi:putative Holliday junction resolvase